MKRTKEINTSGRSIHRKWILTAVTSFVLVLFLGLCTDSFCMVSHAESEAVVTAAKGINIRKEPNSSSEVIGGQEPNKTISIKSQVQGADGYTWYEVYVDSYTTGWVRSDLVRITDGTTPPTGTATTTPNTSTPPPATDPETPVEEPPAQVTVVNPVNGVVTGGPVNIYSNVSAASQLITTAADGLSVTINGTAYSSDGKFWYQVSFMDNGADVVGFMDSAYVVPSGELTAYTPEAPVDPDPPVDPAPPEAPKEYETLLEGEIWYLVDNTGDVAEKNPIEKLLSIAKQGQDMIDEANKKANRNQVIVIVLVFLLVGAAVVIGFLVFKIKDMMDSAYYKEVERDTMKRRETSTARGSGQRVMTTVGGGSSGQRPAGASQGGRPAGTAQGARPSGSAQGTRPAGSVQGGRPGGTTQGARPAGSSQGGRPVGSAQGAPQGTRSAAGVQGARPAGAAQGARPAGAVQGARPAAGAQGARSVGNTQGAPQGARPAGGAQSQRSAGAPQGQKQTGSQGWKSRNFMSEDDDEFEFEFLNYEGDEE